MKTAATLLLSATAALAQGGLATPVNPPPGFPNFYRPLGPPPPVRPRPFPPLIVGPGYNPLLVPNWSWGTGYAAPVQNVTIIERAPDVPVIPIPPLHPAHLSTAAAARRRAEVAATVVERTQLTLTLPAAGMVWLDGAKQDGVGPEFVLSVPPNRACEVRAEWTANGTTFEYTRTVTLEPGDKPAVTVFRGDVKK